MEIIQAKPQLSAKAVILNLNMMRVNLRAIDLTDLGTPPAEMAAFGRIGK